MAGPSAKYGYYLRSIAQLLVHFRNPLLIVRIFTGTASHSLHSIGVRKLDLRFEVRSAMDVWSVKEAIVDRFYEQYGFAVQPGWTVVDIGAAIGEFAVYVAASDSRNRVLAFEPFPESVTLLRNNVRLNKLTNVQVFPEAVSGKPGTIILDASSGEPLKIESRAASTATDGQIAVTAVSLADVLGRTESDRIDLLKLDCEGSEYDILLNAAPGTLQRIDRIVMEYHDTLTEYTHRDLVTFLEGHGYSVDAVPNAVHPTEIGYLRASQ
ncbi:MAG: FkbM family methyltransferase [Thermomicrobiales bacterium]